MKRKKKKHIVIVPTPEGKCAACGNIDELRPYGKDDAWICFTCAMKDRAQTQRQFEKHFVRKNAIIVLGMPVQKQPPP